MNLISKGYTHAFRFHATLRFIDKLCIINDDGDISSSYKYIFPKQLEQKLEHQGEHATFLYLGITIEDNKFVHKLFDKRDKFSLFIVGYYVCLLCLLWLYFAIMAYLSSKIPSSIFYGSIFSEFLWIAWWTLGLTDYTAKLSQLYPKMVTRIGNMASILLQIKKNSRDALNNFLSVIRHMTK